MPSTSSGRGMKDEKAGQHQELVWDAKLTKRGLKRTDQDVVGTRFGRGFCNARKCQSTARAEVGLKCHREKTFLKWCAESEQNAQQIALLLGQFLILIPPAQHQAHRHLRERQQFAETIEDETLVAGVE